MSDKITRFYTRAKGRRVINRGDDFYKAIFHGDFNAQTAKFTFGLNLHILEMLFVQKARMRVQAAQHPLDRGLDKFFVRNLFDIVATHPFKDIAKQF